MFEQPIPTLQRDGDTIRILDQTLLPFRTETVALRTLAETAHAIRSMQVRGAPLIGATAAFGVALALADEGADAWVERSRTLAQEVLDRLSRERGHRFDRVGAMHYGYRVDEVDLVADKLARYLETGESLTVEQVRTVAFRMKRGGYREDQVDAVLDAMVEVLLAVG